MSFARFLLKRAVHGVAVIWGVVTVVFVLRFLTPGSPVDFIAPLDASPDVRRRIARELGLHKPFHEQYLDYLFGLLQGDMGYSYLRGVEASTLVLARVPATVELAVTASLVAVALSIPLGVVAAIHRGDPADYGATMFSLVGISTPNFWLGIMLILVLSVQVGLFPTSGRPVGFLDAVGHLVVFKVVGSLFPLVVEGALLPPTPATRIEFALPTFVLEFPLEVGAFAGAFTTWLHHIVLPAVTLGTYFTALITRLTRSGMLDELGKSYVRAARAKGLPETLVRYRHALRNTLVPIVTVVGLQLGTLIGGAVITEAVFAWPGLGSFLINAINVRDWPLIQGSLIVIGVSFVVVNIAVDALYAYLDPRVVYE